MVVASSVTIVSSVRWHPPPPPTKVESTINDSHKVYDTTINCQQPWTANVAPTINMDRKIRTDDYMRSATP